MPLVEDTPRRTAVFTHDTYTAAAAASAAASAAAAAATYGVVRVDMSCCCICEVCCKYRLDLLCAGYLVYVQYLACLLLVVLLRNPTIGRQILTGIS